MSSAKISRMLRIMQVVYGNCYFFEPFTLRDLYAVDPKLACEHFSDAFCNPAEFHIALTGAIEARPQRARAALSTCSRQVLAATSTTPCGLHRSLAIS